MRSENSSSSDPDSEFKSEDVQKPRGWFATTHWSVVVEARKSDSNESRLALESLCNAYWYPLYAYVRRRGYSVHDAEDLTQEFFTRLLEKKYLDAVDRKRGKFRTFLLSSLEHFLAKEWRASQRLKRGGGKVGAYFIPDSVITIGFGAFMGCSGLTSVTIPNTVFRIGIQAFDGCTSLISVYFEGNPPILDSLPVPTGLVALQNSFAAIVYYRQETTGWGDTFGGRPTALWRPPPVYGEWLESTNLPSQYPEASTPTDDPDLDNMNNYAEMLAGTDPTKDSSVMILEQVPRPENLTEEDKITIEADTHPVFVRSIAGKTYAVQWAESLDGPWHVGSVVTARTSQTRFVFEKSRIQRFFRAILAQ